MVHEPSEILGEHSREATGSVSAPFLRTEAAGGRKPAYAKSRLHRDFRAELCNPNHHILLATPSKNFSYHFGMLCFAKYNLFGMSSSFFCLIGSYYLFGTQQNELL